MLHFQTHLNVTAYPPRFGQGFEPHRDVADQVRDLAADTEQAKAQANTPAGLKKILPPLAEAYSLIVQQIRKEAIRQGVLLDRDHPTTRLLNTVRQKFPELYGAWLTQIRSYAKAAKIVKSVEDRCRMLTPEGQIVSFLDPELGEKLTAIVLRKKKAKLQKSLERVQQLEKSLPVTGTEPVQPEQPVDIQPVDVTDPPSEKKAPPVKTEPTVLGQFLQTLISLYQWVRNGLRWLVGLKTP